MPPGAAKEGKKERTSTVDHNLSGPVAENLPANAGDTGLIPGPGYPTCHRTTAHIPRATLCNEKPVHHTRVASTRYN